MASEVGSSGAGPERAADLVLDSWRLRVSGDPDLLAGVLAVMAPPCTVDAVAVGAGWTVRVQRDEQDELPCADDVDALFTDRPVLVSPCGGPQLAVVDASDGLLRLLGRYRSGSAAALLEVDRAWRTTRVVVPEAGPGRSWLDWVARLFFSSRMLAGGWRLLHASAVVVDGAAVLFIAGQGGGKSTLAYRACAQFMADDLVMVGPGGIVAGWPTRAAPPVGLTAPEGAGPEREQSVEGTRQRVLFTPHEHRAVLGCAPPTPLGVVVHVTADLDPGGAAGRVAWATPLEAAEVDAVMTRAADVPAQRLYSTDLLGLTGGPSLVRVDRPDLGWDTMLGGAAGARLTLDDLRALPQAPVWEALSVWLPGVKR
ncbi:hypothetical protein FHR32_006102 [Streptosporangium album]|uniref:HprK-related kinase B n=1 Tax=Streptosporangium album TaxID=47479 RepID=A0A7W7S0M3_9ACTN|nr:hypothetical protein [Streptosporangium album]MBB4941725.1 hypothetical protein [Streptosporangium album]